MQNPSVLVTRATRKTTRFGQRDAKCNAAGAMHRVAWALQNSKATYKNQVGGGIALAVLTHHRANSSVHGGFGLTDVSDRDTIEKGYSLCHWAHLNFRKFASS
jgi:hypothetical protein